MLNIASFITPLAVRPDPNAAAANLVNAEHNWANERQNKDNLTERTRHSQAEEGLQKSRLGFDKQVHADTMEEHHTDLVTKLIDWGMGVLDKEGPEKARAIVGPVWGAAGIDVDFGGQPSATTGGQVAPGPVAAPAEAGAADDDGFGKLQAAQTAREAKEAVPPTPGEEAQSYAPKPGESLSQYVARGTKQVANGAPPTEQKLDEEATEGPQKASEEEAEKVTEGQATPWKIYDRKTGRVYGTIDPEKVDAINQKRAYEGAVAYSKGTPEPGKPIVQEFTRGARNEADLERRMTHAERAESELNKTIRVEKNHKGGGGVPEGYVDTKLASKVDTNARMYMNGAMDKAGVSKLNQMANEMGKVDTLFDSSIPAAQRQAFASQLKANFGAAASEGERRFMEENAGLFNRMMFHIDSVIKGGEVPPELRTEMQEVSKLAREYSRHLADGVAEKAAEDIMQDPTLGGFYEKAFGNAWTPEAREKKKKTLKNLGHVDTGTSSHEGDMELENILGQ